MITSLDNLKVIYFNKLMMEYVKNLKSQNDQHILEINQTSQDQLSKEQDAQAIVSELKSSKIQLEMQLNNEKFSKEMLEKELDNKKFKDKIHEGDLKM